MKHLSDYELENIKKETKAQLIERLEYKSAEIFKLKMNIECSGNYKITTYKNKKEVNVISFTWDDNPHGANWGEVKDLAFQLANSYQDYESNIETKIEISDDWDETPINKS